MPEDDFPGDSQPVLLHRPLTARKGRGAVSNLQGRYETLAREAFDDGWTQEEEDSGPAFRTEVLEEQARSILTRNASPDVPFDVSLNPYRGCEHVIRNMQVRD